MQTSLPSPTNLGDYKIGKTIGQGAFSKVKLGTHNQTGQKFAIKIIDKKAMFEKRNRNKIAQEERLRRAQKQANNPHRAILNSDYQIIPLDYQKMIQNMVANNVGKDAKEAAKPLSENKIVSGLEMEVQLMMRLDHPNIIKVYQVLDSQDECLIVMDYASGGEMIEHVAKDNYLTEAEGRRYFRQLISAIDHFHLASVVHRDLKLENILLTQDKNLVITDFGLGRTFEESETTHEHDVMSTFCGTPNYAAYELVSGIPYDGVKTDIWAMGVILFIMLSGNPPFKGVTVTQVYRNIKELKYRVPRHFSSSLVDLIDRILVRDPERRIDIEGLRRHPWVNQDYAEPPLRIIPQFGRKADISERVSGISFDKTYTVININNPHTSGASSPERNKMATSPGKSPIASLQMRGRRTRAGSEPPESNDSVNSAPPAKGWDYTPPSLPSKTRSSSLAVTTLLRGPTLRAAKLPALKVPFENSVDTDEESIQESTTSSRTESPSKLIQQQSVDMKDLELWHETHRPPKSIRTMQLSFRSGTTTTKDPVAMFQNIHQALIELKTKLTAGNLEFKRTTDYYVFECRYFEAGAAGDDQSRASTITVDVQFELEPPPTTAIYPQINSAQCCQHGRVSHNTKPQQKDTTQTQDAASSSSIPTQDKQSALKKKLFGPVSREAVIASQRRQKEKEAAEEAARALLEAQRLALLVLIQYSDSFTCFQNAIHDKYQIYTLNLKLDQRFPLVLDAYNDPDITRTRENNWRKVNSFTTLEVRHQGSVVRQYMLYDVHQGVRFDDVKKVDWPNHVLNRYRDQISADIQASSREKMVQQWLDTALDITVLEESEMLECETLGADREEHLLLKAKPAQKRRNHNRHICENNVLPGSVGITRRFTRQMGRKP